MNCIYLDSNATTLIHPEVANAMDLCHRAGYSNPASQHRAGRRARQRLDEARDEIGRLLGAVGSGHRADIVILTSGGTEANNLAILGLAAQRRGRILVSSIEHPSVAGPAERLAEQGFEVRRLRVNQHGVLDLDQFAAELTEQTCLVSVMLANNETGVIQPIEQVSRLCQRWGVPLHCDAIQAVGKIPVDFRALGAATMSASAHKLHGPPGVGVLLVRHAIQLHPILHGGFQQAGLRPGTEPIAMAVGMSRALELFDREKDFRIRQLTQLRNRLEHHLTASWPQAVVIGKGGPRLPHTSNIAFPGLDRQALLMALDLAGIACSTGSACSSGASQPSPVLQAMGLPNNVVHSALRFSLSALNSAEEINEASRRILQVLNDLRPSNKSRKPPSTSRHLPGKTL